MEERRISRSRSMKRAGLGVAAVLAIVLVGTAWPAATPPPQGTYLPPLSLFELTRKTDLIVLARPSKGGDQVRVYSVLGGKAATKERIRSITVANFTRIWYGLNIPDTENAKGQKAGDFRMAILFLRRDGDRWWICESIPRARAANGCIWIRDDQVHYYPRRVWREGNRLVTRYPAKARAKRAERESMTSGTLMAKIQQWNLDLMRLRQIEGMKDPMRQVRALRAFVAPSTQPPHSPESIQLARQAHAEAYRKTALYLPPEKSAPPQRSVWEKVRGGPSDSAAQEIAALESNDAAVRARAIQRLRTLAAMEVVAASVRGLRDDRPEVRQSAAEALMDFADPSTSEPLVSAFRRIENKRDPVRRPLVYALVACGAPEAIAEVIYTFQEPDEPFRSEATGAMLQAAGRPLNRKAPSAQQSASYWAAWYRMRFGTPLQLKPWGHARLQKLIESRPQWIRYLPTSEFTLIPPETIQRILADCAEPSFPNRARWCEILIRTWEAGALTQEQMRKALETFGVASVHVRDAYPLATMATLSVSSLWPSGVQLPRTFKFSSKSQAIIDGEPVGRAYPLRYPGVYLYPPLRPGDYGPGRHSLVVQIDYAIQGPKGAIKHQVKSDEKTFEVVLPGSDYGLERKTGPELDSLVERVFRFVPAPEADLAGRVADDPTSPPLPPPKPIYSFQTSSGRSLEVYGKTGWELTEPLPVDLAFRIEYEFIDQALMMQGSQIYVARGQKSSGTFNAYAFARTIAPLSEPGVCRFRVHLTPDRDVALSQVTSQAYWDGFILTSPELHYRLAEPPQKKK